MAKKQKDAKGKKDKPTPPKPSSIEMPALEPGDTVAVSLRITEGDKTRTQTFQGTLIGLRGAGADKTFTVRKVSRGYGIERIFPFGSPSITKVEVKRHSKVRRSKLYYLRGRAGKSAQLREKRVERKPRPKTVES